MLRNCDQRKWDENLPEIQFAINTAIQESTGFSAAQLNFGRHPKTAKSLYDDLIQRSMEDAMNPTERMNKIQELCELARRHMQEASMRQAKYYNMRRREWSPAVGDSVYKKNHYLSNAANAFNAKLAPAFSGPFVIINYISPTVVELKEASNPRKVHRAHLKDLKEVRQSNDSPNQ